jgi:hypothetical protein
MTNTMWTRGVEWLAAAAADPRSCKWEWDHGEGVALLEVGRFWDVLSGGWVGAGLRYATKGAWVAVPPPYRPARFVEWLVPPDGTGTLHAPAAVEEALRQANGTLAVLAPLGGR